MGFRAGHELLPFMSLVNVETQIGMTFQFPPLLGYGDLD